MDFARDGEVVAYGFGDHETTSFRPGTGGVVAYGAESHRIKQLVALDAGRALALRYVRHVDLLRPGSRPVKLIGEEAVAVAANDDRSLLAARLEGGELSCADGCVAVPTFAPCGALDRGVRGMAQ